MSLYSLSALRTSRSVRSGSEDDDVGGRKDYLIRNQSASQSAIDNDSSISKIHNFGSYSKQRSIQKTYVLHFVLHLQYTSSK